MVRQGQAPDGQRGRRANGCGDGVDDGPSGGEQTLSESSLYGCRTVSEVVPRTVDMTVVRTVVGSSANGCPMARRRGLRLDGLATVGVTVAGSFECQ